MRIENLTIIGTGLIGGSLARALRVADACGTITGFGRSREHMETAVRLGVIDRHADDVSSACRQADVIVLATPLSGFAPYLQAILASAPPHAILTDVGSVKGSVVADVRRLIPDQVARFVPGHPIAGTERSGVEASFAELFRDHRVILTPLAENPRPSVEVIRAMWSACGAKVVEMDVDTHDRLLAATSHLPHVLAYALVDYLAGRSEGEDIFRFAAGGFRDFTRIASSSPEMWADICLANRDQILAMIGEYRDHLGLLAVMLETGNHDGLLRLFEHAKTTRDRVMAARPGPAHESVE